MSQTPPQLVHDGLGIGELGKQLPKILLNLVVYFWVA